MRRPAGPGGDGFFSLDIQSPQQVFDPLKKPVKIPPQELVGCLGLVFYGTFQMSRLIRNSGCFFFVFFGMFRGLFNCKMLNKEDIVHLSCCIADDGQPSKKAIRRLAGNITVCFQDLLLAAPRVMKPKPPQEKIWFVLRLLMFLERYNFACYCCNSRLQPSRSKYYVQLK